ncbi:hypothetical protein JHD48_02090 [Sulfurimonas sp. SAG-AH-194-I05]|nr:hypothetical protein [Sulfurimonas sp. SAG-AH-194-I05]MDF1874518.1 hypothetical protein [Sulfurimonas sp. SAG-AH-194-I05]
MIYLDVKRYLKTTYLKPSLSFEWTPLYNIQFFAFIETKYTSTEFNKEISEVKEAFKDFFEPIGKVVFRYKEESGIRFKIFPYSVQPQNSKHLKNIIKIINSNRKHIKYPYQEQNDQIAILGKIRREINQEIGDTQESINAKELIKHSIRIALDLGERDIVVQLKRKYIVKIFQKNKILEVEKEVAVQTIEPRKGEQNRFNGYSKKEIEEAYTTIFNKEESLIDTFLETSMDGIFLDTLDFRVITNKYYEENALKVIHSGIAKELTNYVSFEKDYLFGMSGYIMRLHFHKIHEIMAVRLIECIYDKDVNANKFLSFYNGNIILIDNKKYKIPSLETEDGQQWNNSSLIGICNLWMNTKTRQKTYQAKLVDTNMKLDALEKKLSFIKPERDKQELRFAKAKKEYDTLKGKYLEIESKLDYLEKTSLNSTEYFAQQKIMRMAEHKIKNIKVILLEAKTSLKVIKESNMTTYSEVDYHTNQKKTIYK